MKLSCPEPYLKTGYLDTPMKSPCSEPYLKTGCLDTPRIHLIEIKADIWLRLAPDLLQVSCIAEPCS